MLSAYWEQYQMYIQAQARTFIAELLPVLEQPSISHNTYDVRRCAEMLVGMLRQEGAQASLMETGGNPVVYGEIAGVRNDVTVVLYNHYDVKPVEPLAAWHSEPFRPVFRRGRVEEHAPVVPDWQALSDAELRSCLVYARGSGDDKGPLYGNLMALRTMRAVAGKPPCRLKFLFDGEEEMGSPNLPAFLRQHRERFQGDVMVIADGPMHPSGRPTVSLGVRGVMMLEINLHTANQVLHSGHYGNAAPNAAWDMVQLLATMRDPTGNCLIEDFYTDAQPPTSTEQELLAHMPFDEAAMQAFLGLERWDGPAHLSFYEKTLFRPTFNINGLRSGTTGAARSTAIPHQATASIDVRLVANMNMDTVCRRIVEHVKARCPGAQVDLLYGYEAYKVAVTHPQVQKVVAAVHDLCASMGEVEQPVILPTMGGSLPLSELAQALDMPLISVPLANHDDNQHAPDENLRLGHYLQGISTMLSVVHGLSQ
ncbi:MAG: M20 family dipeptidase [Candidatus Tectomicrobia bacterium]|uniref:M20 family dipeptidase n=1 Tax=Tectimicrobiota bacterium TaxID=2528274 RepID=A0A937VYR6_UNCTE|nr:M20 family dipeptidase [Candidatus Tectomicrobia bacterium]